MAKRVLEKAHLLASWISFLIIGAIFVHLNILIPALTKCYVIVLAYSAILNLFNKKAPTQLLPMYVKSETMKVNTLQAATHRQKIEPTAPSAPATVASASALATVASAPAPVTVASVTPPAPAPTAPLTTSWDHFDAKAFPHIYPPLPFTMPYGLRAFALDASFHSLQLAIAAAQQASSTKGKGQGKYFALNLNFIHPPTLMHPTLLAAAHHGESPIYENIQVGNDAEQSWKEANSCE